MKEVFNAVLRVLKDIPGLYVAEDWGSSTCSNHQTTPPARSSTLEKPPSASCRAKRNKRKPNLG